MARVALIRPSLGSYYGWNPIQAFVTLSPPLNLALLAGALRRAGHAAFLLDLEATPEADVGRWLGKVAPDLVGITFRTPQFHEACRIAFLARAAAPRATLVAGGPHATTEPHHTLRNAPFHLVVRGEGEESLVELASGTPPPQVAGVVGVGFQAPDRPRRDDLDHLPLPAWDLLDLSRYRRGAGFAVRTPVADVETSRGCPGRCAWCTRAVLGHRFRPLSARRSVDLVQHAAQAGFRSFNLVDDAFTTDLGRAVAFCEGLLSRGLDLPWTCTNGIRVTGVDEAFFRLARRAGCHMVAFGFESGDDGLLAACGKGATVAQARAAARAARKGGLLTVGYFMLGLPGETRATLESTLDLACSLDLDLAKFSLALPLPGTPLGDQWRPWFRDADHVDFSIHQPQPRWFDHPDLPWPVLEEARMDAYMRFYGRTRWARHLPRILLRGR